MNCKEVLKTKKSLFRIALALIPLALLLAPTIVALEESSFEAVTSNIIDDAPQNAILLKSRTIVPTEKFAVQANALSTASIENFGKAHILVQFNHILTNEEKESLKGQGVVLHDYIPERAWVASVSGDAYNSLKNRNDVTFIDY